MNPSFERYIGIDYSGAETPTSSLKGLRISVADLLTAPQEIQPPPSPRKYWTRRGIAEWLVGRLSEEPLTLIGMDHGFSGATGRPAEVLRERGGVELGTQIMRDNLTYIKDACGLAQAKDQPPDLS